VILAYRSSEILPADAVFAPERKEAPEGAPGAASPAMEYGPRLAEFVGTPALSAAFQQRPGFLAPPKQNGE